MTRTAPESATETRKSSREDNEDDARTIGFGPDEPSVYPLCASVVLLFGMAQGSRKPEDGTIDEYERWLALLESAATDDDLMALHEQSLEEEGDDDGITEDDYGEESSP